MSGAEASYAKFSNSPLVRGDNSSFEPSLFNKVGGVRGCTGATNNVAAANSNPGDNYKLVGGAKTNYVLDTNLPNLKLGYIQSVVSLYFLIILPNYQKFE